MSRFFCFVYLIILLTPQSRADSYFTADAYDSLARGIASESRGAEVEALFYYIYSLALEPNQEEAAYRLEILRANISGSGVREDTGNISANVRNEIQLRRDWIARLTETEEFFYQMLDSVDFPYTLFYSTRLELFEIDFQNETVAFSFPLNLRVNRDWVNSIQETVEIIFDGLNETGRKNDWGLSAWPSQSQTETSPFNEHFLHELFLVFQLVNNDDLTVGTQTVYLSSYIQILHASDIRFIVDYTENFFETVYFNAVEADDVGDALFIHFASVNSFQPENTELAVRPLPGHVWDMYYAGPHHLDIQNGILTGFNPSFSTDQTELYKDKIFPTEVWTTQTVEISGISAGAFRNRGLLGDIFIPDGTVSIGARAFSENRLEHVTFPDSVVSIGDYAFSENSITGITIGSNVNLEFSSFDYGFYSSYILNERNAGTYSYGGGYWNVDGTGITLPVHIISPNVNVISDREFENMHLGSIIIPYGVSAIGEFAFYRNQLDSVIIPDSVTTIGQGAFSNNRLSTVTISNNVSMIGINAFSNNYLTSISFPDSVTIISGGAFSRNRLTAVTLPNTITTIGAGAFSRNQLAAISLPESVTRIWEGAFEGNNITMITIGANVEIVDELWGVKVSTFENEFADFYRAQGRRAGTYIFDGEAWSFQ